MEVTTLSVFFLLMERFLLFWTLQDTLLMISIVPTSISDPIVFLRNIFVNRIFPRHFFSRQEEISVNFCLFIFNFHSLPLNWPPRLSSLQHIHTCSLLDQFRLKIVNSSSSYATTPIRSSERNDTPVNFLFSNEHEQNKFTSDEEYEPDE